LFNTQLIGTANLAWFRHTWTEERRCQHFDRLKADHIGGSRAFDPAGAHSGV
jgi:hypothetical protein